MRRAVVLPSLVATALCAAAIGATLAVSAALSPHSSALSYTYGAGTSGADAFGYTWDDTVPYAWIDARSGGTESSARGDDVLSGEIPIGFTFEFYENAYTHCYFSTNGLLTFDSPSVASDNIPLPSPLAPGNLIAPFWDDLCVAGDHNSGRIFYQLAGTSPNRYFVVEWWEVSRCGSTDPLTLELVLYETGDILFQYMSLSGDLTTCTVGIQNATGRDGLQYLHNAAGLSPGKAIKFIRPPRQARVGLYPSRQGQLGMSGRALSHTLQIQNLGDRGVDTFELAATSVWPLHFYDGSGTNLLVDTDGDGQIDTGQLASARATTVTAQVTIPTAAKVGDWDHATVTVTSSVDPDHYRSAAIASAVPPAFAQSYTEGWDPFGALDGEVYVEVFHPAGVGTAQLTWDHSAEESAAIIRAHDGRLICTWPRSYWHQRGFPAGEIEYIAAAPGTGDQRVNKVTNQARTIFPVVDVSPTLAVAPNGSVAFAWTRQYPEWLPGPLDCAVENVFCAIHSSSGDAVKQPTRLSGNAEVYCPTEPRIGTARDFAPVVAATHDNHFVIAWQKERYNEGYYNDIYYAVVDADGDHLRPATELVTDTVGSQGTGYFNPRLLALPEAQVLVLWDSPPDIHYAVLSGAGEITRADAILTSGFGGSNGRADAAVLPNGNIFITWTRDQMVAYTILSPAFETVLPHTLLANPWSGSNDAVSVTATPQGQVVLTWQDGTSSSLYYALLAGDGQVMTPPMPFRQPHEDWIAVNKRGYGQAAADFAYVAPSPTPTPVGLAPRTVLAELFSSTHEPRCTAPEYALSRLVREYGLSQLGALQYFPSSEPPGSAASDFRAYLYRVMWSPIVFFNGTEPFLSGSIDPNDGRIYKQYRGMIEFERTQASPLTMSLDASFSQDRDEIHWMTTVEALTDVTDSSLMFDCFLYEDPVMYALEGRTRQARYVVRTLSVRQPLTTTQGTQVFTATVPLSLDWIPDNLGLVALVQDQSSRQVLQTVARQMVAEVTPSPTPVGAVLTMTLQEGLSGYTGTSDTYVSAIEQTRNFDSPPNPPLLRVKGDGSYTPLIRFALPDELRGQTTLSAVLELRTRYRDKSRPCSVGAYRLRRLWLADQATWLNATDTEAWSHPGISPPDCDTTPLAEQELSSDDDWYQFDVTQAVRDWIADPDSNYGLLLKSGTSGAVTYDFASSESRSQEYRPKLVILYSEPAVTPIPTFTQTSTPTATRTPTPTETRRPNGTPTHTRMPTCTLTPTAVSWHNCLPVVVKMQNVELQPGAWLWVERHFQPLE